MAQATTNVVPLPARPHRVQLKRTRGWRMPPNTVKVDRSTAWGNPFFLHDPARNVSDYRRWIRGWEFMPEGTPPSRQLIRAKLGGKNLACWCAPGQPCHADVLLEIANA